MATKPPTSSVFFSKEHLVKLWNIFDIFGDPHTGPLDGYHSGRVGRVRPQPQHLNNSHMQQSIWRFP